MYAEILRAISDALQRLKKDGYDVFLWLSDVFPEPCRRELAEFLPGDATKCAGCLPVSCDDREVAGIAILKGKESVRALAAPFVYLLERLYEESCRALSETHEQDAYRKALQYIKEHYTEGITITDVATHTGYSGSYFGYLFKKKHSMSVIQYVRELQLAKAKDLLLNTSFSISAVAGYVGFDDPNYFSSLFKKHFGLSPKEYRKLHGSLV